MYKTLLVGLITFLNISLVLADNFRNEPIKPIQPFIITEPAKVELGKKLFLIQGLVYFSYPPLLATIFVSDKAESTTCSLPT